MESLKNFDKNEIKDFISEIKGGATWSECSYASTEGNYIDGFTSDRDDWVYNDQGATIKYTRTHFKRVQMKISKLEHQIYFYLMFCLICFLNSCGIQKSYTFNQFHNFEKARNIRVKYYKNPQIELDDNSIKEIVKLNAKEKHDNWLLGEIFYKKGQYKKAISYFTEALKYEMDFMDIDSSSISKVYNDIKIKKFSIIPQFRRDTDLICEFITMGYNDQNVRNNSNGLNFLVNKFKSCKISTYNYTEREKIDSINLYKLDSLFDKNLFPNQKNVNFGPIESIASLIVIHQDKKVNEIYLERFIDLARRNNTNWFGVISVCQNLIKRFPDTNGYCALPYFYLNNRKERNSNEKRNIVLYSLYSILKDNKNYKVEILDIGSSKSKKYNNQIIKYLVSKGIEENRVITKNNNDTTSFNLLIKFSK